MTILKTILTLAGLSAHLTRFLHALLSVWLAIPGTSQRHQLQPLQRLE